jgi:hypothetical protein
LFASANVSCLSRLPVVREVMVDGQEELLQQFVVYPEWSTPVLMKGPVNDGFTLEKK